MQAFYDDMMESSACFLVCNYFLVCFQNPCIFSMLMSSFTGPLNVRFSCFIGPLDVRFLCFIGPLDVRFPFHSW